MSRAARRGGFGWPEGSRSLRMPGAPIIVAHPISNGGWRIHVGREFFDADVGGLDNLRAFLGSLLPMSPPRGHHHTFAKIISTWPKRPRATRYIAIKKAKRAHLAAEKNQPSESEGQTCSKCGGDGAVGRPPLCWPCRSGDQD